VHNNTLFRTYADKSVLLEKFWVLGPLGPLA
jgi:hypothetical protein